MHTGLSEVSSRHGSPLHVPKAFVVTAQDPHMARCMQLHSELQLKPPIHRLKHQTWVQLHEAARRHGVTEIATDVYTFLSRATSAHLHAFCRRCAMMARQRRDPTKRCCQQASQLHWVVLAVSVLRGALLWPKLQVCASWPMIRLNPAALAAFAASVGRACSLVTGVAALLPVRPDGKLL